MTTKVAIIGSGNIGSDLMLKIQRYSSELEVGMLVGIDPDSDGLARARALGVPTTHAGIDGLVQSDGFDDIAVFFDATSAKAHARHDAVARETGRPIVDLTPAALGPGVVPVANLDAHLDAPNVNMVTCGGQATIPIVWAVAQVAPVRYGEIIASISSRSAGPGTRANIDEFTVTTANGIEAIGGAAKGKAIIILNPAEPPLIMRDTVHAFFEGDDTEAVEASIRSTVEAVQAYVPGYRMVQRPVFEACFGDAAIRQPDGTVWQGTRVSVFLEVEGNGDYLPPYAGNLDIMTAAALRVGERIAAARGDA